MHAFLYDGSGNVKISVMSDLGTLGGDSSYGTFINAKNHVVGYSATNDGRMHAFLHRGDKMADLGSLGGKSAQTDQSFALGINSNDQVVGYTYLPFDPALYGGGTVIQPQAIAFIYQAGVMRNLNDLIGSAAKNYQRYSATAINDAGQIVTYALDLQSNSFRSVLLTPLPVIDPPQASVRRRQ